MISHRRNLNNRQIAFARAVAAGSAETDAQRMVGYVPNRRHRDRLMCDLRILAEIDRLRDLPSGTKSDLEIVDSAGPS